MADRYWVGGTGNWDNSNTASWSATSGGAGGASIPTISDNVFLNASSGGGTISCSFFNCLNFNTTGFTGTVTLGGATQMNVYGSYTVGSTTTISSSWGSSGYGLVLNGSGTIDIAPDFPTFISLNGSYTLARNLNLTVTNNYIEHNSGTFTTNNFNVTAASYTCTGSSARTLNMGSGTWTLTSPSSFLWTVSGTNFVVNSQTSTINLLNTTPFGTRTFLGGGASYYNLTISGGTSTSSITSFTGANTFNSFTFAINRTHTINFQAGLTSTFTNISLSGTPGNTLTIRASGSGTQTTLSKSSGTVVFNYVAIQDVAATGGATWLAGPVYTNNGNNSGFITVVDTAFSVTGVVGAIDLNTVEVLTNNISPPSGTTKTIFLKTVGNNTWTIPNDFESLVSIECIGGGGGSSTYLNYGGGGGAYSKITSLSGLSANGTVYINVDGGGAGGISPPTGTRDGVAGSDTWFNKTSNAAPTTTTDGVLAKGGSSGATGNGGLASISIGTTKYDGGGGGLAFYTSSRQQAGGGGGGAAGPNGAGAFGGQAIGSSVGTNAGAGGGGANGGTGGANTNNNSTGGVGGLGGTGGTNGGNGGNGNSLNSATHSNYGKSGANFFSSLGEIAGAGGGGGGGGNGFASAVAYLGGSGGLYGGGGAGWGNTDTFSTASPKQAGSGAQGIIVFTYNVASNATVAVTGVIGTSGLGTASLQISSSTDVIGIYGIGLLGTADVATSSVYDLTGVSANFLLGNVTVTTNTATPSGVYGTGQIGDASTNAIFGVNGVFGTGVVGSVALWFDINTTQNSTWVGVNNLQI
jgi:hypothetical protein